MAATDRRATAKRISEADGVLDGLRESLAAAGLALPSLQLHHSTWSATDDTAPALIELGACNLDTARRLAAALRRAES